MINQHDNLSQRCRRLGSDINFEYCRLHAEQGQPCSNIIQCWWERFDVHSFFKEHLTSDQLLALEQPQSRPKITTLMEIIQKAQRSVSK